MKLFFTLSFKEKTESEYDIIIALPDPVWYIFPVFYFWETLGDHDWL